MLINEEAILDRLEELKESRVKLLADINAHDGAIQDCEYWLERLNKIEIEEVEEVNKND